MDRTAFRINTFAEADSNAKYWVTRSPEERLRALEFLNRQVWNIAPDTVIAINRSASSVRIRKINNVFNKDFQEFIEALNTTNVKYILVGGYAVNIHGYSRTTGDIDLWVDNVRELPPFS